MDKGIVLRKIQLGEKEFNEGASKSKAFNEVTVKIIKAEGKKLVREVSHRRGEAWSALANQVVGSEDL